MHALHWALSFAWVDSSQIMLEHHIPFTLFTYMYTYFTLHLAYMHVCWSLPSNQLISSYMYWRGVDDDMVGQWWEGDMGQQTSYKTFIGVHSTMYLMHPSWGLVCITCIAGEVSLWAFFYWNWSSPLFPNRGVSIIRDINHCFIVIAISVGWDLASPKQQTWLQSQCVRGLGYQCV